MATRSVTLVFSVCWILLVGATGSVSAAQLKQSALSAGPAQPNQVTSSVQTIQTTSAPVSQASTNNCMCGVFLSDQFVKGSSKPPTGDPPFTKEVDDLTVCSSYGVKQCINRCVESLVSFMPKSGDLICAFADREVFKQRAYLFVNNCNQGWYNTKFSAGRELCCAKGEYYKCPM